MKKEFTYNQWAGPCHIEHGRQQGIDFLKDNNIVQDTLPLCQKPKDVKLGEKLDAKVPDGYKMVEEKILDTDEKTYLGYGKKSYDGNVEPAADGGTTPRTSGIRIYAGWIEGSCYGLSAYIKFFADEYVGIIKTEKFVRHYVHACNKNDTYFPSLAQNQEIIGAWNKPDDHTYECDANEGIVQERL